VAHELEQCDCNVAEHGDARVGIRFECDQHLGLSFQGDIFGIVGNAITATKSVPFPLVCTIKVDSFPEKPQQLHDPEASFGVDFLRDFF
jgi:hypothetical protein